MYILESGTDKLGALIKAKLQHMWMFHGKKIEVIPCCCLLLEYVTCQNVSIFFQVLQDVNVSYIQT